MLSNRTVVFLIIAGMITVFSPATLDAATAGSVRESYVGDLAYYHRTAINNDLSANDRLFIINKLITKYRSTGIDIRRLHAEKKRLTQRRTEKTAAQKTPPAIRKRRLRPHDTLNIAVRPASEFSTTAVIDRKGTVILDLAGPVQLGGLTIPQAEKLVTDTLRRFVAQPQVTITRLAEQKGEHVITLLGAALRPGKYPLAQYPTLSVIIAAHGGMLNDTQLSDIHVLRNTPENAYTDIQADLTLVRKSKQSDIVLKKNDIVWIPNQARPRTSWSKTMLPWGSLLMLGIIIALVI